MKILIIGVNANARSETFIHQHITYLGSGKWYLYGNHGIYSFNGEKLSDSMPIWKKLFFKVQKKNNQIGYYALENFLKKHNITHVLAEYGLIGVDILHVCKKLSIALFVHFHGYDASVYSLLEQYKYRYKEMFVYASAVFVVSKKMHLDILNLGCEPNKIVHNPYGPQKEFYSISGENNSLYFLAVGRFVEKKAPHIMVLAFAQVLKTIPDARLIMVGDGALLGACKWLSKSLSIDHAIEFTGGLKHEQVIKLFQKVFCFVQHSVTATNGDTEGTPVAVLEAGAAGLPVVSTFHAGIPEVVLHDRTGFLVEEGNFEKMAEYMHLLYVNRILAKNMGDEARKHVMSNFSSDSHIEKIKELFETAIHV